MPFSGLPNAINNDQSSGIQQGQTTGVSYYAAGAYGATWNTTAAITAAQNSLVPNPVNGDEILLWNTDKTAGRYYVYMAGAWRNGSAGTDIT